MSLLGIDVGTTGCKVAAFSLDGTCSAQSYREYPILHPRPGWAELDSIRVWADVQDAIREVCARTGGDPVAALCVSSFGEAAVPVTRDRRILGNSIVCSMDARGAEHAERLRAHFGEEPFYRINPNVLGPQYTLPKLMWLREHQPALFEQTELFLLWADFVGFMLGADPATGNSLANRTLLFDLDTNDWSQELLAWAKLTRARLGPVVSGGTVVGTVSADMAERLGLPKGVRIVAGGHDQCCNALGSGCIEAGKAVCGIGTFECITPTFTKPRDPIHMLRAGLNIEHHVLPGLFVSFLFNLGGALVQWFRDTFAAADMNRDGRDVYALLNAELPEGPTRLLVLPHFEPPVFPRHIPDSAGAILGLHTHTTRGEILKALMECETFYFIESLAALRDMGIDTTEFIATGGGAKSDAWLQIKADILGVPFIRPGITEASVVGAAMLAGLGTGAFSNAQEAVARFVRKEKTFEPNTERHAIYREKAALYAELFPSLHGILRRL